MPRCVFTPAVIQVMRDLASEDTSASEIAAAIGSTPGSVRVKCCQLKIALSRGDRANLVPSFPSNKDAHKLVVTMRSDNYIVLKRKAAQMHKTPIEFAGMLLQAIISANLFDAVLDDRE
jgi:hypothetical protein